jgi:hypothetical protein
MRTEELKFTLKVTMDDSEKLTLIQYIIGEPNYIIPGIPSTCLDNCAEALQVERSRTLASLPG